MLTTSAVISGMKQLLPQEAPGPQKILKALTSSLGTLPLAGLDWQSRGAEHGLSSCSNPELSCQAKYSGQDTCCFNYPGGQMLLTQFWDADPAIGPDDSWTIHGLWPDHCDGGFDQYCDSKRKYSNISLILIDAGRGDLLDYMTAYWKDFRGDDPDLWEHEWNKHGTCISTLETKCYMDYYPQQEVVDYFDKTVEIFQKLPSYQTLADAGIVPSYTQTYSLDDIKEVLKKAHGTEVTVRCHYHSLNEIWYHFNVAGSLQAGKFIPSTPDGLKSNCPARGIRYLPKRPSDHKPTKTTTTPAPTGTDIPFTGRGHLQVSEGNRKRGCIISRGAWFSSGTCAVFKTRAVSEGTFTLHSSKGPCTFERDVFGCGPHITTPDLFTFQDGLLQYCGNTTFFADKAPKGYAKSKVFATQEDHPIEISMSWHTI